MRAWWNSLTSSNRHADSKKTPYNSSFTSIRTGLTSESVTSLSKQSGYSSYALSSPSASQVNLSTAYTSQFPGLLRRDTNHGMLMQDFQDGVAPAPAVVDSWRRIDEWAEDNYPELYDQLTYGATEADVDELEHTLEMNLPIDVRESFFVHDGQERGGRPTGLLFGIALLDCEELVDEYELWKKVAAQLPRATDYPQHSPNIGSSSANGLTSRRSSAQIPQATARKRPAQAKQGSRPEGAVQCVYAHPGWIPLAKDYMGNNIGIDLAPGPKGRVGQVILFGRDCDIKYVVAPSWASFLAMFVSDLESDNVIVEDDVGVGGEMGPLRYVPDMEHPEQQHSYIDILKARVRRRDRALRGTLNDAGSSTSSINTIGVGKRHGKARASSPLKTERFPRSNLGTESVNVASSDSKPQPTTGKPASSPRTSVSAEPVQSKQVETSNEEALTETKMTTVDLGDEPADPAPSNTETELLNA